jgi:hypothetical protein
VREDGRDGKEGGPEERNGEGERKREMVMMKVVMVKMRGARSK